MKFEEFFNTVADKYADSRTISRSELVKLCVDNDITVPQKYLKKEFSVSRGVFKLPDSLFEKTNSTFDMVQSKKLLDQIIPMKDPSYVKFGYHDDIKTIIDSQIFYPIYITGLSGNGKTFMVEQICAELNREMIRVNITKETDEDDLLGGFRLVNGETVYFEGPVVKAMRMGAVLLLDEVHLASMNIMCLQPVLEGKGVFLKKINKFVTPAKGFNVVATANTKGKFSEVGNFSGANILDEAFLDRFSITIEQEYPNINVEKRILKHIFSIEKITDDDFIDKLTVFSNNVRKMYLEGGLDEVISTRRLVSIAKAFVIFRDYNKSIDYCINRFDDSVKTALKCFWEKLFEAPVVPTPGEAPDALKTERINLLEKISISTNFINSAY